MISIIIPTYNHIEDYLIPCIHSIIKYTNLENIEIIVVSNGSNKSIKNIIDNFNIDIKLLEFEESLGYTKATNIGINASIGEYVILLNDDTVLLDQPKNLWIDLLLNPFEDEKTGITGPVKFYWDCNGIIRNAMAFWCVMIKREILEKLSYYENNRKLYLNEIFNPGMGEDGDFSIKTELLGYNLVQVPNNNSNEFGKPPINNFPIYHKGNGTFEDPSLQKDQIIERNKKILEDLYGIEISIIIPTYNHFEDAFKPCIESVFKNTDLSNKEIIVIANGCTDDTQNYLKNNNIRYIWFDEPCGYINAVNAGIKTAKGKYVLLLDNDCIITAPNWIDLLKSAFDDDKIAAVGPFVHYYDNLGLVLHSGCALYKKEILEKIGLFDEIFNPGYLSDADVSLKIQKEGYKCKGVPENKIEKYNNGIFELEFPIIHMGNVQTMNKAKDEHIIIKNMEILKNRYYKNELDEVYDWCLNHPCDINEHFPILKKYSELCDHITEFGVRDVFSTYAFMVARPKRLISYDINVPQTIWTADRLAKENNVYFSFMERNTLNVEIEETDLLFIDTRHTYSQLKKELTLHAKNVKKYIIMHDTVSYGYIDEPGEVGDKHGLIIAIEEFLEENKEWEIKEIFTNNNGLMVLARKPLISIIIPTYNHLEDCLKPCIESIIKYTDLCNVEIIIVANGCMDNTKEYIESLGNPFKLIFINEQLGYTKATNLGIKESKGEYIILLNNDTVLLEQSKNTWIEMLKFPFKNSKDIGITGPLKLFDRYSNHEVIIFFCCMIKKQMFDMFGLLDEEYSPGGGEDVDFSVKVQLNGYKIVQVPNEEKLQFIHTNTGEFPIWHKDNQSFKHIPEYATEIVKRNGLLNLKKYNKDIRLNIGSGGLRFQDNDGKEYINIDLYDKRADIIYDITKLYEIINSNSVNIILASHVIEHLNPYHFTNTLRTWFDILKPGGKLIMEYPDIEELCKRFVTADLQERYTILNCIYGSVNTHQALDDPNLDPTCISSPHLFNYSRQMMKDHLVWAGFKEENIKFMEEQIKHPGYNIRCEVIK